MPSIPVENSHSPGWRCQNAADALIPDMSRVQVRGPLKNRGSVSKGDKRCAMGRPPGSVDKITREMREAVLAAADEVGHIPFKNWKQEINKQIEPSWRPQDE